MAYALVAGLVNATKAPNAEDVEIRVADPQAEQLEKFQAANVYTSTDNNAVVQGADAVVLAVKPQIAKQVMNDLDTLSESQLLISIAAGITTASLHTWSSATQPIIRCMPNTPALVQQGATALFANTFCSNTQQQLAAHILDAIGISLWVDDEAQLDAVTAVSGSGPAYFFLLMEAMIEAGVELGLSKTVATQLTLQTARGAAEMAQQSEDSPGTLRNNVTSPGGTTAAALGVMQDHGIDTIVNKALKAAQTRSIELAEEFGN